tara:strand:- start:549 stop:1187 length:639 start_codon:yes stop_codon:yes gene_type:complete
MSSNTYGYIADTGPTQAYGSNNGVFDPADINDLIAENKWSGVGTLELIETQSVSSATSYLDFTNLGNYNVHFMTVNNFKTPAGNSYMGFRLFESGVIESAAVYQFARQQGQGDGTFGEANNTSQDEGIISANIGNETNHRGHLYIYWYNLTDSTKYSFTTHHSTCITDAGHYAMDFGSNVLPQASYVDGIRMIPNTNTINEGDFSLYGIRYS